MAYETTTFDPDMQTGEQLKDRAQSAMQRVRARSSATMEDTVDLVRRNPGKTLAASVLVGSVLGALIVNAMTKDEETRWEKILGYSEGAWDSIRGNAETAISGLRDVVDSALARFR